MPSIKATSPAWSPADDFTRWIKNNPCPLPGEGVHEWIKRAAGVCKVKCVSIDEAHSLIAESITRAPKPGEIANILQFSFSTLTAPTGPKVEIPKFNPDRLAQAAAGLQAVVNEDWLRARSPLPVNITAARFLDLVFPDEIAFVTIHMMAKGGFRYTGQHEAAELQRWVDGNTEGAWYLANPIDGELRDGSFRSGANLTAHRHIVLESDVAPRNQWLAMLAQEPIQIIALTTSGNRSIHALVRIPAKNKVEFDKIRDRHRQKYCPLGADPAAMSAVRLTRLPGVIRKDNFAYQQLLWFDPKTDGTPIYKKTPPGDET